MTANEQALANSKAADLSKLTGADQYAFSVDVEEWFQVGAFENTLPRESWPTLESRVERQTCSVLQLLETLSVKGTFFCLGSVAERTPSLIREIVAAGHELACHGTDHRRLFTLKKAAIQEDIAGSKKLLEDISGTQVLGYRAPSFSLTPEVWWVYEFLREAGFAYSSSLYPVKTDHYGMENAPRGPFYPLGNGIHEIPMTVCDTPFGRAPASGGGYFRLLPYGISKRLLKKGAAQAASAGVFYMHPWEMDLGQPYVAEAALLSRFRHYQGQAGLPRKLRHLASDFKFVPIKDIYCTLFSQSSNGAGE